MTPAQKKLRDALDKQSRARGRMAEIGVLDEDKWTPEIRSEFEQLEKAVPDTEARVRAARAAVEAEEGEQRQQTLETPDGEQRERIELRSRASLTNFLLAAMRGQLPSGPEAELQAAAGVSQIPIELFDLPVERRADTTTSAPSTTGVSLQPVFPLIYARSVLPRLGVAMPRTGSGGYATATITAGLAAAAKTKGAAQESTAATLTAKSTAAHRVSARLSIAIEDIAIIGTSNFEAQLRSALQLALSDRLDFLGLTGDGQNANPQGLLSQLTDPTDPTAVVDFDGFVGLAAGGIDGGPWAEGMGSVRLLVNAETMRKAETTFQTATNYKGELSAGAYLRDKSGGFFASARMPATAATIAQCLRVRMGTMGLDGVNAGMLATCPVWAEVGVDDIYSDSASGIRHFTLHSLIGDVLIIQSSAYERVDLKLS